MSGREQQAELFDQAAVDGCHFERWARSCGFSRVAGVDEVGRGPLAGPVVAAAVILPAAADLPGVQDSKLLSPGQRLACLEMIRDRALAIGIGQAEPEEIDRHGIHRASLLAMAAAVARLQPPPDIILVDGPWLLPVTLPQRPLKHGDRLSVSIAAASIVAKVHRDQLMQDYHRQYPHYNFARNKGYGTREHREALAVHGPCPIHRRSFRGVS